jgi:hypothetical protein
LGHAHNAKAAGFYPVFVFPKRKNAIDYNYTYEGFETIKLDFYFNVSNHFSYLISILKYFATITKYFLLKERKVQYIMTVDFECTFICFLLKLKKVKIITLVNDNFSIRYNLPKTILYFLNIIESFTYKFISNYCIFPDQCRVDLLLTPPNNRYIYIIPNVLNDNIGDINYIGNPDSTTKVLLCGWLDPTRGLEILNELIKLTDNDVYFILTGSGKFLEKLEKNTRILYLGQLTRLQNLEIMSTVDLNMAFYNPNIVINRFALPQKVYDSFLIGCPVLINSEVTMSKDIIQNYCGYSFSYFDVYSISKFLNTLKYNKNILISCSRNISIYNKRLPNYKNTNLQSFNMFRDFLKN